MRTLSNFFKTFTGVDTLCFALFPECRPILIGSLTTLSYSMYRDKKPVPILGKVSINGVAKGPRMVAGTMIFTLINQHFVHELRENVEYLNMFENLKADELPPFDIMVVMGNEYGSSVYAMIYGVEYTDESQVTSIEDMFIENTFSFICRDLNYFKDNDFKTTIGDYKITGFTTSDIYTFNTDEIKSSIIPFQNYITYNSLNVLAGEDIVNIQKVLLDKGYDTKVTGIFDLQTYNWVRQYQADMGLEITGSIDDKTYNSLFTGYTEEDVLSTGFITSMSNVFVYEDSNLSSNVVYTLPYKSQFIVLEEGADWTKIKYANGVGYVLSSYMYSNSNSVGDFKPIAYGSNGYYTEFVQKALNIINGCIITGNADEETVKSIKSFESQYNLNVDGVIDKNDYIVLGNVSKINLPSIINDDGLNIQFQTTPGIYNIDYTKFNPDEYSFSVTTNKETSFKLSAICTYKNGKRQVYSKMYGLNNNDIVGFDLLPEAYLFNAEQNSTPTNIEYILYPLSKNAKPYKWIINMK